MRDVSCAPEEVRAVNDEADVRVLHRLDVREGHTGLGRRDGTRIGVAVDVETTGIGDDDVIIEFALRRFRYDPDGVIVTIDSLFVVGGSRPRAARGHRAADRDHRRRSRRSSHR